MSTLPSDPADLFLQVFHALEESLHGVLQPGVVLEWMTDETSEDVSSWIEGAVVELGELDPDGIADSIEQVEDPDEAELGQRRRFAILLGLDRAFAHVNPHTATYDQGGLRHLAVRYAETGRLNSAAAGGALLPRFAFPGRDEVVPESLASAFIHVVPVSAETWERTNHRVLANRSDFGRMDRQRGLLIGCAPMIESLGELDCRLVERQEHRFYAIRPQIKPVANLIPRVLQRLDEQGAAIGLMPELVLTDELLEAWRSAARGNPPDRTSRLKWILVGTGPLGDGDPPPNRAVLIDRRNGEILLEQDKIYPFTLSETQLAEWGLAPLLGSRPCAEYLTRGDGITVTESGLGRLAILVCEDLSRIAELGDPLLAHGVSHALAPVFSAEIRAHHWEHAHAKDYADQVGTQVVVANSLAVARAAGNDEAAGTALAHAPTGFVVGESGGAADVCLFRVSVEAAVLAVGSPAVHD